MGALIMARGKVFLVQIDGTNHACSYAWFDGTMARIATPFGPKIVKARTDLEVIKMIPVVCRELAAAHEVVT